MGRTEDNETEMKIAVGKANKKNYKNTVEEPSLKWREGERGDVSQEREKGVNRKGDGRSKNEKQKCATISLHKLTEFIP